MTGTKRDDTTVAIHWITATYKYPEGDINEYIEHVARDIMRQGVKKDEEVTPYPRNYSCATALESGRVSYHPEHHRMKVCVSMTGKQCEEAYTAGVSVSQIIASLWVDMASFTRIDVAIDFRGEANIADIVEAYKRNPSWTRVQQVRPYQLAYRAEDEGVSISTTGVYVGSVLSERVLVVYDKAIEQGRKPGSEHWTRLELRCRKGAAEALAESIVTNGLARSARAEIRQFADCPAQWFQDALEGDAGEHIERTARITDTRHWLLDTVLPVLDSELLSSTDVRDELFRAYDAVLAKNRARMAKRR